MSIINMNGLILKTSPYRERDKLVTMLSPAIGKVQALCKAARDPMNHWTSSIDPPLLAWCSLLEKNQFYQLIDIREMNAFPNLREYYPSRLVYHAMLEAVRFLPFAEISEKVFILLLETLIGIEQEKQSADWFYYRFMIRFLDLQGFQKDMHRCDHCHQSMEDQSGKLFFSVADACFLCENCSAQDGTALLIPENLSMFWRKYQISRIQDFSEEKSLFFHNFKELDRIISVIVKQVFCKDFATLAEMD